jgi:hypothetical protein
MCKYRDLALYEYGSGLPSAVDKPQAVFFWFLQLTFDFKLISDF